MINTLKQILFSVLPKRCAYCGSVITSDLLVCAECEKSLPRVTGNVCRKCGRGTDFCSCKGAEMYFESLVAPFYFEGNVRKGMHAFKFRKSPDNAKAYGKEISETILQRYDGIDFDFITEVPMTRKSVKERGYNQCALLCKSISENLGMEYRPGVLVKIYETEKQHGLNYNIRKGNLTGVFDVKNPEEVKDKTVLICDDIATSGETLNECAKMLWLHGAKEVYCVAAALTKKKTKPKERR
ncbi:MAG: ComF family protein [Clostridia bacterium]|nr:ComF family protein [Clostridia bacterium]